MTTKDQARVALEDAVYIALEAGMTKGEVEEEVLYALANSEES